MKKIGLLSDTHGFLHPAVSDFFKDCDEIWHAGDIGTLEVARQLSDMKPLRAVHGNIDGGQLRIQFREAEQFLCEQARVLILHIGGYPGKYSPKALKLIREFQPSLFISGHSHILKVMYDEKHNLLHINPGAAGKSGLHQSTTMVRFIIDGERIRDLEVYDQPRSRSVG
ncbi:MAG: metallophosphoesterase family protein [bacterium]